MPGLALTDLWETKGAPADNAAWLIVDARGAPVGPPQAGPLTLAAARVAGRRVCVLVSASDVLLAEPEVPARSGARLPQLVPYALEEHLADDIDSLHFALGRRAPESTRAPVAVVSRRLLDEWLAALREAGIEPDALYADSDLLPENPGQAVALLDEDAVIVRAPGAMPVTLPADALPQALEIAQSGAESTATGARGLILYTGAAEWQHHSAEVEAVRAQFDGIKIQLLTGGPLALFAQQLPNGTAINLLQGQYAPKKDRGSGVRAWRLAAGLLIALVGLHVVGKAVQLHFLKSREHQVDASIRDTFRTAMPGEPLPADPRHRMESRLSSVRQGAGGLLPALQALAQASQSAPGTSVQSLNFHSGMLESKLSAPDASHLDQLSQSLRGNGWQSDLVGGNNTAQGYEGRIQMRAGGG